MLSPLPKNATLNDLRSSPKQIVSFARSALGVFKKVQKEHGVIVARIGVTGTGKLPNYRFETAAGQPLVAIDGANHRPWAEDANFAGSENWSTATMTYEDIESVISTHTGYNK